MSDGFSEIPSGRPLRVYTHPSSHGISPLSSFSCLFNGEVPTEVTHQDFERHVEIFRTRYRYKVTVLPVEVLCGETYTEDGKGQNEGKEERPVSKGESYDVIVYTKWNSIQKFCLT